ncbi:hypothetical protein [Silvimonas sp.]|uniref:hypothetical protein n=1 Tax=Silvimonas sp. TaxID=2650811 RepID=UPI00284C31F5|nr:hypothetical protein [Silvimonas sp.]MDR3425827.1 hypothetical protein [Silvimonas sp.]
MVTIEQGEIVVKPVAPDRQTGPQTISSSDFWESLGQRAPKMPDAIRALLAALEPLGVYPDLKAALNLKADLPNLPKPVNFGYITKTGKFWTDPNLGSVPETIWRPYFETLARLIGGQISTGSTRYVSVDGRSAPRIDQFLPKHQDDLVEAIATMLRALNAE